MKGLAKFGKGLIDFGKDLIDFGKDVFQRGKDFYKNVTSDDSEFKKSLDNVKKEIKDIKEVFSSNKATQQNTQNENENESVLVNTAKLGKSAGENLIDFGKGVFQSGKDIYNNVTSDDSEFKKSLDIIKKEAKDIKEVFSSADAAKVGKSISDTYKSFAENFKTNTNQLKMFDDNGFDEKQASAEQNLQQNENQTEEASKVRRMMRN